jgi:hypothetical protein
MLTTSVDEYEKSPSNPQLPREPVPLNVAEDSSSANRRQRRGRQQRWQQVEDRCTNRDVNGCSRVLLTR